LVSFTATPPKSAFQRQNVVSLMPYRRHTSTAAAPAAASFKKSGRRKGCRITGAVCHRACRKDRRRRKQGVARVHDLMAEALEELEAGDADLGKKASM
jgi:hypothetical protein